MQELLINLTDPNYMLAKVVRMDDVDLHTDVLHVLKVTAAQLEVGVVREMITVKRQTVSLSMGLRPMPTWFLQEVAPATLLVLKMELFSTVERASMLAQNQAR